MARQPANLSARKGPALNRAAALAGAIVVLIAFCAELYAQQHYFRHYGDYEGLSQLDVRALLQDQKRFIWAGTEAGLNRYDGSRFEEFDRRDELQCKNLQLEQANRIKDIFLHNMSHEIRTPLTSMLGFADILVEEAMGQHRSKVRGVRPLTDARPGPRGLDGRVDLL